MWYLLFLLQILSYIQNMQKLGYFYEISNFDKMQRIYTVGFKMSEGFREKNYNSMSQFRKLLLWRNTLRIIGIWDKVFKNGQSEIF